MPRQINVDNDEHAPLLISIESSPTSKPHPSRHWQCVVALLLVALIALISVTLFAFLTSPSSLKEFPPDGPGIGIALSTDYNTISVRQDNSAVQTVARIPVTQEYAKVLRRLSLPSSQHPAPPYRSLSELMHDRPRQWLRNFRKKFGYPASSDVGIIAEAIRKLITAVEEFLPPSHLPLSSALVALPNAIALYPEDVQDALEYLGLQALRGHNVYTVLRALPAAYAGYELGLCTHPGDFELC